MGDFQWRDGDTILGGDLQAWAEAKWPARQLRGRWTWCDAEDCSDAGACGYPVMHVCGSEVWRYHTDPTAAEFVCWGDPVTVRWDGERLVRVGDREDAEAEAWEAFLSESPLLAALEDAATDADAQRRIDEMLDAHARYLARLRDIGGAA